MYVSNKEAVQIKRPSKPTRRDVNLLLMMVDILRTRT